jgi:hypothetical protein
MKNAAKGSAQKVVRFDQDETALDTERLVLA